MKRFALLSFVFMMVLAAAVPSQAAGRSRGQSVSSQRNGVFARLMEMERRKNAALREMFRR